MRVSKEALLEITTCFPQLQIKIDISKKKIKIDNPGALIFLGAPCKELLNTHKKQLLLQESERACCFQTS